MAKGDGGPLAVVIRVVRAVHWYLRELTGETAYDRYLEQHSACKGEPLTRREFERCRVDDKEVTPGSRCC